MAGAVRVEREGGVATLLFDHPERRNAVTRGMWEAIPAAARALDADPAVRVVVLRGAGEVAFVSGADISEFGAMRLGPAAEEYEAATRGAFDALAGMETPVLALVHGFCVGGGAALALTADLRFAADDAVFAIPPARLGLGYSVENVRSLVAVVGDTAARRILLTGDRFDAAAARAMGLVDEVLPKADLDARVAEVAARIADNAPLTLRAVKLSLRALREGPAEGDLAGAREAVHACFESADYREGVRAFLEKRRPRFEGR